MTAFNGTGYFIQEMNTLNKCCRNKIVAAVWRNSHPNTKVCLLDSGDHGTTPASVTVFLYPDT